MTWTLTPLLLPLLAGPVASPLAYEISTLQGPETAPIEAQQDPQDANDLTPEQVEAVMQLLRDGKLEDARSLINDYIVVAKVAEARAALAAGEPRDGLEPLDAALALKPNHVAALLLRAQVAMAAAPADSQPQFFYEDAAKYYDLASRADNRETGTLGMMQYDCLIEGSRAQRMALQGDAALESARRANSLRTRLRENGTFVESAADMRLERVWANAAFDAYVAARQREEDAPELRTKTQDLLAQLTTQPDRRDAALLQLVDLHQWAGDFGAALTVAERALEFAPSSDAVHQRLAPLLGGNEAIVERYARFRAVHPEEPIGWWYGGSALFTLGLEAYEAGTLQPARFEEAEALFQKCLGLEPPYVQACKNQICLCRAARGWCLFFEEDLAGARNAFESMEAVQPRGMTVSIEGRVSNGVVGLTQVAGKHHALGLRGDLDAALIACTIGDLLHRSDPTDGNLANNAGFLNRDAAVGFEARRATHITTNGSSSTSPVGAQIADRDQALELMANSWSAYQAAAKLLPDDCRVVNDAGLIMLYYVRTEPAVALALLQQSIAAGEAQMAAHAEAGTKDIVLQEALGDAYENLGLYYLTCEPDAAQAKVALDRSYELGPYPRQIISGRFRPLAERLKAGETLDDSDFAGILWTHQPTR